MTDPVREFARLLLQSWTGIDHDHMDIDGGDVQDFLLKSGLGFQRPITAKELAADEFEWAAEYGYEPGDAVIMYSDEMKELLREDKP